jgi:hypothetical protein
MATKIPVGSGYTQNAAGDTINTSSRWHCMISAPTGKKIVKKNKDWNASWYQMTIIL